MKEGLLIDNFIILVNCKKSFVLPLEFSNFEVHFIKYYDAKKF